MICRLWRGVTTRDNAPRYEEIVRGEVIPAIEARAIPGFLHIDLARRDIAEGVEFLTIMWFDSLAERAADGRIAAGALWVHQPHPAPGR